MEVGNLDIVIGTADSKSKPMLEVKYYDQQNNRWLDMLEDVDVDYQQMIADEKETNEITLIL